MHGRHRRRRTRLTQNSFGVNGAALRLTRSVLSNSSPSVTTAVRLVCGPPSGYGHRVYPSSLADGRRSPALSLRLAPILLLSLRNFFGVTPSVSGSGRDGDFYVLDDFDDADSTLFSSRVSDVLPTPSLALLATAEEAAVSLLTAVYPQFTHCRLRPQRRSSVTTAIGLPSG